MLLYKSQNLDYMATFWMAFHSYRESLRGFVVLERGKLGLVEERPAECVWEQVVEEEVDLRNSADV